MFTSPAVAPIKVPSSSVTIGPVTCVAKTVAVAVQIITSDARRKAMIAREKDWQSARRTSEQLHEKESWLK